LDRIYNERGWAEASGYEGKNGGKEGPGRKHINVGMIDDFNERNDMRF